jgi:hypothetical protein
MHTTNGRVDITQIYERLHAALDSDDLAWAISRLSGELAAAYHADMGVKIGAALGWGNDPHGCTCEEAEAGHQHCPGCDCVLAQYEDAVCRSCVPKQAAT